MTLPSPNFKVNGNAVGVKASVAAGAKVTCLLDSTEGVKSVQWSIIRTDETTIASQWNTSFSISGSVGQQLEFDALTAGTSCIVQCQINAGKILGELSDASRFTAKVYVLTTTGFEVLTDDELVNTALEASPTHGAVDPINAFIRSATAGGDIYAIHDNVSNEIAIIANKAAPVGGDYILIEDSEDSNSKKYVTFSQLPAIVGGVTASAVIADNAVVRGDGGAKGIQGSGITVDDSDNMTFGTIANAANTGKARLAYNDLIAWKCFDTTNIWSISNYHAVFDSTTDDVFNIGYNFGAAGAKHNASRHRIGLQIEAEYDVGSVNYAEFFVDYTSTSGAVNRRPFSTAIDIATDVANTTVAGTYVYISHDDGSQLMKMQSNLITTYQPYLWFVGSVTAFFGQEPDATASVTCKDLTISAQGASNATGGASAGTSGNLLLRGGRGSDHADNLDGNIALGEVPGGADWKSAEECIFIADAVTVPTAAATGGSWLYSVGGVATVRGDLAVGATVSASGTIRGPDAFSLKAWGTGPVDVSLLIKDVSDNVFVGDPTNAAGVYYDAKTGGLHAFRVNSINAFYCNASLLALNVPAVTWENSVASPIISQAPDSGDGITADTMTVAAQTASHGVNGTGGALNLSSGAGPTADGNVSLRVGGVEKLKIDNSLVTSTIPIALNEVGDPTTAANQGALYTKDSSGTHLFFRTESSGTIYQLTPTSGGGDVTAGANITDHAVVRGDGGAKGIQDSGILIDDADLMSFPAGGKLGIGTTTVPHGGIGMAMLALDGTDSSADGPHIQITTASDNYPLMQLRGWAHDDMGLLFDAYYSGGWLSSDLGSNFLLSKNTNKLWLYYDSNVAQGATVTWNAGLTLDTAGLVTIAASLSVGVAAHLVEQGAAPATAAGQGAIYLKDASGAPHLFYRTESSGTEYQLTPPSGGIGGSTGGVDDVLLRSDGAGGSTLQASSVGLTDSGFMSIPAGGKLGIGTTTVPHTNGWAMLAIDGAAGTSAGPNIQLTTVTDDHPLMQVLGFSHDAVHIAFDCYFDGAWNSSDLGSNFKLSKESDTLFMSYDSGIAQGAAPTWNTGLSLGITGIVNAPTAISIGATTVATTGDLKLTDTGSIVAYGGSGDVPMIKKDAGDNVTVGASTVVSTVVLDCTAATYIRTGGGNRLAIHPTTVDVQVPTLRFLSAANPVINIYDETTDAAGDDLIVAAQACVNVAGGKASGNLGLRGGQETNSNLDGNIWLHIAPASYQSMENGMFVANATTIPTGDPTSGGFLYATSGALWWWGSGGSSNAIGPAGPHCGVCGYDEWRVATINHNQKSWRFECAHCNEVYSGGPDNVLHMVKPEHRQQTLRRGMAFEDIAEAVGMKKAA
jgi:hypothetical protein